ncbi:multiprotein-bridging factor 1 family protein [Amycolatopsis sp. NPDC059090]|uniref:multiprotein-bridging factor 1 family protein n=1 Tax=unclassified Amycolatopsis TaxID=2618356 RepID=UPI003672CAEB
MQKLNRDRRSATLRGERVMSGRRTIGLRMTVGQPGMRRAREAKSITQEQLAERVRVSERTVRYWESGESAPALYVRSRLARELGISRTELEAHINGDTDPDSLELLPSASALRPVGSSAEDDEAAALELSQRVAASDVGDATLCQLEAIVDDLAIDYATTAPSTLAPRIRGYLAYVSRLMDARMTLSEHRRLFVVGGWFSLLSATVHIDLDNTSTARAGLRNAHDFARDAGHDEIRAWDTKPKRGNSSRTRTTSAPSTCRAERRPSRPAEARSRFSRRRRRGARWRGSATGERCTPR